MAFAATTRHAWEWVTAHVWMSHGTHVNESCLHVGGIYGMCCHVTSHMCCHDSSSLHQHVTLMNESRHTCEWVMAQHTNESCPRLEHSPSTCHTYEWVTAHLWMSHSTHVNESLYICEWVMFISRWHTWHLLPRLEHPTSTRHTCEWVTSHILVAAYIWMGHECM